MAVADWDRKYREGFYDGPVEPHPLLQRFWRLIPEGPVIDIAAGTGRDSLFLAERGFSVCAVERSKEAICIARQNLAAHQRQVLLVCGDANELPIKKGAATGAIVFYFLLRGAMDQISALIKKDGILIYETFLRRQNALDRQRNPDYLLSDGELAAYSTGLDLIFYEETVSLVAGKKKALARMVGRKR